MAAKTTPQGNNPTATNSFQWAVDGKGPLELHLSCTVTSCAIEKWSKRSESNANARHVSVDDFRALRSLSMCFLCTDTQWEVDSWKLEHGGATASRDVIIGRRHKNDQTKLRTDLSKYRYWSFHTKVPTISI